MKNAEEQRDRDESDHSWRTGDICHPAGLTGSIAALKSEFRYNSPSMILRTSSIGPAIKPLNTTRLALMDTKASWTDASDMAAIVDVRRVRMIRSVRHGEARASGVWRLRAAGHVYASLRLRFFEMVSRLVPEANRTAAVWCNAC